jgi:hypothetical protein
MGIVFTDSLTAVNAISQVVFRHPPESIVRPFPKARSLVQFGRNGLHTISRAELFLVRSVSH